MRTSPADCLQNLEWLTIRRRLGKGSFGVVYEAYDRRRMSTVALKTLPEADATALYMLKHEFRVMADVVHPNLATLYDLISVGDDWFVTMELVDGVDLLTYTRNAGNGSTTASAASTSAVSAVARIDRTREAFAQVADGVRALHRAGILHRDLKPPNVLVTNDGRVVILDFGLAAQLALGGLSGTLHLVGTVAYMSPEVIAGRPASEASDWYSVGVMLYEALTENSLFPGSVMEVLARKAQGQMPPPSASVPGIPPDLDALCMELLRPDPKDRPAGSEISTRLGGVRYRTGQFFADAAMGVRPTNLVGRRLHTLKLESAFAAIRNGRPTILHVYGQSGIGKTALIHEFLAELRRRDSDVVVLRGRCYEQEAVPYKALDSLIDDLSRYLQRLPALEAERMMPRDALTLARLFPVLGGVNAIAATHERVAPIPDTNELRRRAANALRELLARIGERHPLVLFIDDVQWGDLDSATLLEELVRPPDPPMLILLLCYRSEDAEESPLLRRIAAWVERGVAASDVVELEVDKLTPAETRDLAFSLLSSEGPAALDRADAIATESDGHPLLLTELVRHIALEPDIETPEMSLDTMIRARVAQLPVQARRLLEILAVAGRPVELTVAQQAAGLDVPADTVISMLRTGHLVRTRIAQNRHEIETYHDRIREAVITQLPAALLKTHHGRLAWSWQASGRADAETLASHFHGAGEFQHAAAYAAQAAEEAGHALAFDRAARLYRLALDLLPASAATEHALRVKLGDALADAGRGAEAADVYLVAANAAEVDEGLELRRRAADQLLISGHIDEGLATLRTVLSMVGIRLARTPARALVTLGMRRIQLRARGLRFQERDRREPSDGKLKRVDTCWAVTRGLIMVDTIRAAQFQSRHLLEALRVGEPYRVARALAIEASASVLRGRRGREHTQRVLELARELAERIRNPHAIGAVALASAAVANFLGRFPEALTMCQRAELILREQCTGVTWELDTTELYRLHSLYWLGRWSELSQRLLTVRREAEQRRDLYILTYVGTRSSHVVYLARNDAARAREEQKRSIATWSHRRFQTQHYWDWFANGEIDLFDGRVREAWLRVRQVWPEYRRSLLQRHQAIFIEALCMRARAALALSADETEHRSVSEQRGLLNEAERAADKIEHEQIPWGNALAQLLRAGVAIGRGDVSRAVMLTRLAEISFGLLGMEMHEAVALRRRGQLIGGDEGRSAQEAGDARMTAQGIGSPVKVAAMLAPGEWQ